MTSRFPRIRSYELMVIFHPETEEEALLEQIDRVRSYITDVDGTVTVLNRDNPWGRRRLAYPIRHESRDLRDGIYVLIYFDTEASRTVDIERELKLNTRIIRYMLIQQTTPTMEPPAPPEAAPAVDGQPQTAPVTDAPGPETSPGTPPEAAPAPADPIVPASAGAPAAAEENLTAPALDSSPAPSEPSSTLPPAGTSLVEVAAAAEGVEPPAPPADDASTADSAPQEAADSADEGDAPASDESPASSTAS